MAEAKNKLAALDAGHGLKTPGKRTPDGIHEWEIVDKIRDCTVADLNGYNIDFLYPDKNEGRVDESLTSRRAMYLNADADVMVSYHANAHLGRWGKANGVEVWVDKNCTAADMELAKLIYNNLVKYTGLKGRGIKKENWAVINQNKVPAVLVEFGFMDNKKDKAFITSEKGQQLCGKAVSDALIEFLDLKKKTKKTTVAKNATTDGSFKVKFKEEMNVRKNAGTKYKKVTNKAGKPIKCLEGYAYTITKTKIVDGVKWGKLKSGAGWVCIASKYCTKVK